MGMLGLYIAFQRFGGEKKVLSDCLMKLGYKGRTQEGAPFVQQ